MFDNRHRSKRTSSTYARCIVDLQVCATPHLQRVHGQLVVSEALQTGHSPRPHTGIGEMDIKQLQA